MPVELGIRSDICPVSADEITQADIYLYLELSSAQVGE